MRILRITPTDASLADVDGSLATLQAIIGGDIQWIPLGHDSAMYAHENGKHLNLPENPIATRLCLHYRTGLDPEDSIAGPAVVVGIAGQDGAEIDCPDTVLLAMHNLGFTTSP